MDAIDSSDHDPPSLPFRAGFNVQAIRVVPKSLRTNKVNAVLLGVSSRLCSVKNESLFQNYTFPEPSWQRSRLSLEAKAAERRIRIRNEGCGRPTNDWSGCVFARG
jgi:hypothetical protein